MPQLLLSYYKRKKHSKPQKRQMVKNILFKICKK